MLYGVSVGPGDPELLTVKAVKILQHCEVIAIPRSAPGNLRVAYQIAQKAVPEIVEKDLLELSLPMTRDPAQLECAREVAAELLISHLKQGQDVAFLTLGDAAIYSTYCYLQDRIIQAGYEAEMIPGVPSFCAAAALCGKSLTTADQPLHIVPASYPCVEDCVDWPGKKVLMKAGKSLLAVKTLLDRHHLLGQAYLVEECGMEHERVVPLPDAESAGYFSMILVEDTP